MIVWIASYPRSGNTFFRVILNSVFDIKTYSIYDDKSDIGADEKTSMVVGHELLPLDFNIQKARSEEKTYYIKTHELLDKRVCQNDKVVYLIRDGRESTLSYTKFENTFSSQSKKTMDTIKGDLYFGGWGDHVKSWSPRKRKNTFLIKFEDLVKDPSLFIEKISNFLNKKTSNKYIPTFKELQQINPKFFRSGEINSWEDIYTKEEHTIFWEKNYTQMIEYGYEYKIPDEFKRFALEHRNFIDSENYELVGDDNHDNANFEFSKKINIFSNQIINLGSNGEKYIIYGNGTISKIIQALIPDSIVTYVDIDSITNHPKLLKDLWCDKIIISVLGREESIMKYLACDLGISIDKIITIDIG